MSKGIYIGANNSKKKIKKAFIGVNGVVRKIKKIFIGVEGVPKLCYSSGLDFNFNNTYEFIGNPEKDWAISFLADGTFNLKSIDGPVDIFLVSGGQSGGISGAHTGGNGGDGGRKKIFKNVTLEEKDYIVKIGPGGVAKRYTWSDGVNGGDSSLGSKFSSAEGSYIGGLAGAWNANGANGYNGTYAFDESNFNVPGKGIGYRFGAAGGSGGSVSYENGPFGGGTGGSSGGGKGAGAVWYSGNSHQGTEPTSGASNSGSGGGGSGSGGGSGTNMGWSGNGGSGIIVIRNHRT